MSSCSPPTSYYLTPPLATHYLKISSLTCAHASYDSLDTTHHSLLTTWKSPLSIAHTPPTSHCILPTTTCYPLLCYPPLATHCLTNSSVACTHATYVSLHATHHYMQPATRYSLPEELLLFLQGAVEHFGGWLGAGSVLFIVSVRRFTFGWRRWPGDYLLLTAYYYFLIATTISLLTTYFYRSVIGLWASPMSQQLTTYNYVLLATYNCVPRVTIIVIVTPLVFQK